MLSHDAHIFSALVVGAGGMSGHLVLVVLARAQRVAAGLKALEEVAIQPDLGLGVALDLVGVGLARVLAVDGPGERLGGVSRGEVLEQERVGVDGVDVGPPRALVQLLEQPLAAVALAHHDHPLLVGVLAGRRARDHLQVRLHHVALP
jgi:hypothetical protein